MDDIGIGVLGAGLYASAVFLPNMRKSSGILPVGIASGSGLKAQHAARKYGFRYATSQDSKLFDDPQIHLLAILTRHNQHTRQVIAGLEHGKHVFCEKPLAIHTSELVEVAGVLAKPDTPLLAMGFNRRFAPLAVKMKHFLQDRQEPLYIHYRINAGYLPLNHWTHDPDQGGGRIIGEACHFIDFLTFLTGELPLAVTSYGLPDGGRYHQDNVEMVFEYPDGSIGSVTYLANGNKTYPKENVEVFCGGRIAHLDNFRSLELVSAGRRKKIRSWLSQDKGHRACWQAVLQTVRTTGTPPIPYHELIGVSLAAITAAKSLQAQSRLQLKSLEETQ